MSGELAVACVSTDEFHRMVARLTTLKQVQCQSTILAEAGVPSLLGGRSTYFVPDDDHLGQVYQLFPRNHYLDLIRRPVASGEQVLSAAPR